MPRRKWIPKYKYERSPHADAPPASLWWWRLGSRRFPPGSKRGRKVVRRYLKQVARGRALDKKALKDKLLCWLDELSQPVKISPRRKRYWTLPAYAIAHDLNRSTFLKRFREMEKIARELYPERVPQGQEKPRRISEKKKREIKNEYKKIARADFEGRSRKGRADGSEVHHRTVEVLAERFELPPFRIGQICRGHRISRDGKFRFPRLRRVNH